jgi:HlyD family secretion protein
MQKRETLLEMLRRCTIVNPVDGTVLEKYAERFELTAPGRPLYKIADLSIMHLKVYVSAGQMSQLKIGTGCRVFIDVKGGGMSEMNGTIQWISDRAEFTPKILQTKEERVKLVYAVKIAVPNDGTIKIGMPGEVYFR